MPKKNKNNKTPANHTHTVKREAPKTKSVSVQTAYSGPIPPAQELANYNNVVPNAAERILQMAEKNQQHQIDIETLALNSARKEARRGQIFAVLITVSAFFSSIAAMIMGFPSVASVIGGITVVSLAIAFIKGRDNT